MPDRYAQRTRIFPARWHPPLCAAESRRLSATELFIEFLGWAAALLILCAYLLLSIGKLGPDSPIYQGMNAVGAVGFVINTGWHGAIPSAVLNVIWAIIGAVALWRILARRRSEPAD